jgi:hypothetical protein
MDPRIKRVLRLQDLANRALEGAQRDLAKAMRDLAEAVQAHARVEAQWQAAADDLLRTTTFADFGDKRAHIEGLRKQTDRLMQAVRRQAMLDAKKEQRKLELWHEVLRDAEREESARLERKETDAVAARSFRRQT